MTWAKFGCEFDDEAAHAGLGDAAYRTHSEAIKYLYGIESLDLRIPKHLVRRFAGSADYELGIKDLVAVDFWRDRGDAWEVVHHADVIRQSIHAQRMKRDRDKRTQRAHRERRTNPGADPDTSADVSADISAEVIGDTDRQTDKHFPRGAPATSRRDSKGPRQ